jgi:hypothetical protein
MYDKYSQATEVIAGVTQLGKHKGLMIVPEASGSPGITMWVYDEKGATFNFFATFANSLNQGPQIFPMNVYAVTGITNGKVYRLN